MANLPPVRIGVLGLGTVGCGTLNVLARNAGEISRRAGRSIEVVAASARSLDKARPAATAAAEVSNSARVFMEVRGT